MWLHFQWLEVSSHFHISTYNRLYSDEAHVAMCNSLKRFEQHPTKPWPLLGVSNVTFFARDKVRVKVDSSNLSQNYDMLSSLGLLDL